MQRAIISFILLISSWYSIAQEVSHWKKFVDKEFTSTDKSPSHLMIELDESIQKLIREGSLEMVRKLDARHAIVNNSSIITQLASKKWMVNNEWKLHLSPSGNKELFYLVVGDEFDQSDLSVVASYGNVLLIKSTNKNVYKLIEKSSIHAISNDVVVPRVESRVIDMNLNPNRINRIHNEFPTLDGSSEVISIKENRYRENDIDLLGRSISTGFESELIDNHADEMATIIAGAGNSFVTGRGVAKKARITSSNFFPVLPNQNSYYEDYEIQTQNHSYGIPIDTSYQAEALAFDQSAFENETLLHVFSSGNEGSRTPSEGIYKGIEGFANLTGDIKMTKNSLVVGSVDTLGNEVSFTSRGPTYDGRVKPEVVAYSVVGSSNSAALTSGVATLLQQEYKNRVSSNMPSALVKALLINSAEDVGAPGLDFVTGYGNINAYRSMVGLKNGHYFSGTVDQGQTASFILDIPSNAINLKVTLCWVDPPANVGDITALVNDLDLRLIGLSGVTLPWVLDSSPTREALASEAMRGEDHLNNVEQVSIENPESNYSIEVEGNDVAGSQIFYLAYQYELENSFEWDFPTASDNMPYNGETGSYFRWSTTLSGFGRLEYSINNGDSWNVLAESIDLEREYWRWNSPPLDGDSAIARITFNSEQFVTEQFTLSAPLNAGVGFNCGDSLMLKWEPVKNARDYSVLNLDDNELTEIATTADTFLVVNNKSEILDSRFTIRPNLSTGKSILPAPTFDYTLQGVGCYVFSFFQTVVLDTGIYLNLTLGTTYGIDEIVFQRNEVFEYVTIGSIKNPETLENLFLDDDPTQGYNEHRAILYFNNGEELILSAGASYYLTKIPVRVYPNPVNGYDVLNIITKQFDDTTPIFELLDVHGKTVVRQIIQGTQDFVPLPGLNPGIYFYRLSADGIESKGRVLIR